MKRFLKTCMVVFVMMLSGALKNESTAQVSVGVSFQTFYDDLSPYGEWIYYPEYGYVWSPDHYRYSDFHPYRSGGHWVWSDEYDWFWASDYDWGWAPFHYGRWFYDDYYGWLWVPDYDWSPAWVVWRGGVDYYGWAPMRPGININLYFGGYSLPYDYWCFAPRQYITSPRIYDHCVGGYQNSTIINNTTIINNYQQVNNVYTSGPSRYEAERYTHTRIQPVTIRESERPGRINERNNEIDVYKPSISRQKSAEVAPRRFEQYKKENDNTFERRNIDNSQMRRERNFPSTQVPDQNTDQQRTDNKRILEQRDPNNIQNERRLQERKTFPRNERSNNRNTDFQQPQSQPQIDNSIRQRQQEESQRRFEEKNMRRQNERNDVQRQEQERQYQQQEQKQRAERQNRPDIQRPQPQMQNPGSQRREFPQAANESQQSRGNGNGPQSQNADERGRRRF